jgi:Calcium-dependent channel, 7TM region, putative phosphate
VCSVFMQSFLTASALSFLISASTPVLNALLLATQRRAVAWERGTSDDSAATRIMSTVFQAQVANTGLLMLLVFGRPPAASGATVPPLLRSLGVFNGPYDDFSRKWYGTVGAQLCASLVLAALTPHITRLLQFLVQQPLQRRRAVKAIAAHGGSAAYAMQHDLNQLWVGPQFEFTTRYSYLLTVLFVGMGYAGAMPLMLPLLLAIFVATYWIDKTLLLRHCRRPPHREDALQRRVNSLLPWALLLRLSFACWAYGAPYMAGSSDTVVSRLQAVNATAAAAAVSAVEQQYGWLLTRLLRVNVFPLFLLFLVVLVLCSLELLSSVLPLTKWLWWLVRTVLCCQWGRSRR